MKHVIAIVGLMLASVFAKAQSPNPNIYGTWVNGEQQILKMYVDDTFERMNLRGEVLASGKIEYNDEHDMHIIRTDNGDSYHLDFYVGVETFVVTKPNDEKHAWIFRKAGN